MSEAVIVSTAPGKNYFFRVPVAMPGAVVEMTERGLIRYAFSTDSLRAMSVGPPGSDAPRAGTEALPHRSRPAAVHAGDDLEIDAFRHAVGCRRPQDMARERGRRGRNRPWRVGRRAKGSQEDRQPRIAALIEAFLEARPGLAETRKCWRVRKAGTTQGALRRWRTSKRSRRFPSMTASCRRRPTQCCAPAPPWRLTRRRFRFFPLPPITRGLSFGRTPSLSVTSRGRR